MDIAPSAIAYASQHAGVGDGAARYVVADFTTAPLEGEFDLAMTVHGEFNTMPRERVRHFLARVAAALAPAGRLLLEMHPSAVVEAMGRKPRAWSAWPRGLFDDAPYLRLDESRWSPEARAAVNLNWIVHPEDGRVERFGTVTHSYTDEERNGLLRDAGFGTVVEHPSLAGDVADDQNVGVIAERQ